MRHFDSAEVDLLRCFVRLPYLTIADLQLTYQIYFFKQETIQNVVGFHMFTLSDSFQRFLAVRNICSIV